MTEALARIRGIPEIPAITEVNVRSGTSTSHDLIFKVPVGMSGQRILEVDVDAEKKHREGKTYQWFKLLFDGGAVGWVRDDLVEIQGDCGAFGYPHLPELTWAFALTRITAISTPEEIKASQEMPAVEDSPVESKPTGNIWRTPGPTTVPVMTPVLATGDFPDAPADEERIRKIAYQITATWEGGFSAINTFDSGIVSYGFLQFTLAGGSLISVLNEYLANSDSETANQLQGFMEKVVQRSEDLRRDQTFLNLLREAAKESAMIGAQYKVATDGYWQRGVFGYVSSRELKLPLSWALLFDMGVNFGVNHGFVRLAERELGVPSRSKPAETGLGEEQLMTYVAQLRKRSHDRQAERDNLPGLSNRGNFWMQVVTDGDWYLQGNQAKNIISNGQVISVT